VALARDNYVVKIRTGDFFRNIVLGINNMSYSPQNFLMQTITDYDTSHDTSRLCLHASAEGMTHDLAATACTHTELEGL
jgi:hypothetical protein